MIFFDYFQNYPEFFKIILNITLKSFEILICQALEILAALHDQYRLAALQKIVCRSFLAHLFEIVQARTSGKLLFLCLFIAHLIEAFKLARVDLTLQSDYPLDDRICIFFPWDHHTILLSDRVGFVKKLLHTIEKRLKKAREEELGIARKYDFLIVNDDLEACIRELHRIIQTRTGIAPGRSDLLERLESEVLENRV